MVVVVWFLGGIIIIIIIIFCDQYDGYRSVWWDHVLTRDCVIFSYGPTLLAWPAGWFTAYWEVTPIPPLSASTRYPTSAKEKMADVDKTVQKYKKTHDKKTT